MIPTFPEFKPLEPTDRAAIEAVVHTFPPYSDFSFTNLYAWDRQVSSLHGNLVVRYSDYVDEAPFFTFIGRQHLVETATQLLEFAKAQYHSAVLRLVPGSTAHALSETGFVIMQRVFSLADAACRVQ